MSYMQSDFNTPTPQRHILYMALLGSYRKTLKIMIIELFGVFCVSKFFST